MHILPVMDIQAGVVVRGVGGRRREYRPIVSCLTTATDPATVAAAFRSHFGLTELYLADLDAIAGGAPAWGIYDLLQSASFPLWVDAGVRDIHQAEALAQAGLQRVVLGLETVASLDIVRGIYQQLGGERLVFSLDLKKGQPLSSAGWSGASAEAIADQVIAVGVWQMIVLDLAQVGEGQGTGTEELCRHLHRTYPHVRLTAGGGVRQVEDLHRLRDCGVQSALVASCLHDGRLTAEEVRELVSR